MRAEHMRCALRAAQRIVHVGSDVDGKVCQARIQAAGIDAGQLSERAAARRQAAAVRVQQAHAQGRQHAGAGVVGGRSAQAQDEALGARVHRRQHQFAHAMAAGAHRIALGRGNQFQARRRGHFDHRSAIVQEPPDCIDLVAQRVVHLELLRLASGCRQHGLDRAFAAVGHRDAHRMGAGEGGLDAARNGRGRIGRGNAFFERVGSDDDFHGFERAG
ncbi:hypothetical protein D9M68_620780 [compost metagenome]